MSELVFTEFPHCVTCGERFFPHHDIEGECFPCVAKRIKDQQRRIAELEAALVKAEHDRNLAECERNEAYAERDEIASDAYLVHKRYAPTDGDARPTEELLRLLLERDGGVHLLGVANDRVVLWDDYRDEPATDDAPTARAALIEALKERGQ